MRDGRLPPASMEPRKQFLCRLVATRPEMVVLATPEEDRIVRRHFEYLKSFTERGIVLLVGRTQNPDPTAFGIHILLASSEGEARRVVDDDPRCGKGSCGRISTPTRSRSSRPRSISRSPADPPRKGLTSPPSLPGPSCGSPWAGRSTSSTRATRPSWTPRSTSAGRCSSASQRTRWPFKAARR
ncbi:MAG: hypothetical protein E6K16_02760 [Methanobacteriota archaeon]|nr:MAG: hypothetical protein E6K16_02760 [Euryarchaeota archaeon]